MPWPQLPTIEDIGNTIKGVFMMFAGLIVAGMLGFGIYELSGCGSKRRTHEADQRRLENIKRIEKEIKELEEAEVAKKRAQLEEQLGKLKNGSK